MTPLLLAALAALSATDPATAFALRAQAAAIDESCNALASHERAALDAGLAQSRRDLQRGGVAESDLLGWEARLREDAQAQGCASQFSQAAIDRYRHAYRIWMREIRAEFDGPRRAWRAERPQAPPPRSARGSEEQGPWRVIQTADAARFGLAMTDKGPVAMLAGRLSAAPASATLVLRDRDRARPVDATAGGLLPPPGGEPLAAWGPPRDGQTRFLATARYGGAAAARYSPEGEGRAYAFAFSRAALDALARLEPQESARLDIHAANGARLETVWVEAGLLQSALDFVDAAFASN